MTPKLIDPRRPMVGSCGTWDLCYQLSVTCLVFISIISNSHKHRQTAKLPIRHTVSNINQRLNSLFPLRLWSWAWAAWERLEYLNSAPFIYAPTCSFRFCQRPQGLSSKISLSSSLSSSLPPDPDILSGTDIVILSWRSVFTCLVSLDRTAHPGFRCLSHNNWENAIPWFIKFVQRRTVFTQRTIR